MSLKEMGRRVVTVHSGVDHVTSSDKEEGSSYSSLENESEAESSHSFKKKSIADKIKQKINNNAKHAENKKEKHKNYDRENDERKRQIYEDDEVSEDNNKLSKTRRTSEYERREKEFKKNREEKEYRESTEERRAIKEKKREELFSIEKKRERREDRMEKNDFRDYEDKKNEEKKEKSRNSLRSSKELRYSRERKESMERKRNKDRRKGETRKDRRERDRRECSYSVERKPSSKSRHRTRRTRSRSRTYKRRSRSRRKHTRSRSRTSSVKRRYISQSRSRYYGIETRREDIKVEDERKRREVDEARRDDLTVLVVNLSLKSNERVLYEFFSEHAGKVRDVQCIRDQRSGKLKGVGYVEFYTEEAVIRALALSGQCICGQPIKVQSSQAEKNRAAKAARHYYTDPSEGPMRLYVGGLVESLSNISEVELKALFSPFGEVLDVDIHKDPYTGRSKGYAFVQFRKACDGREAMVAMNGFQIGGREIKIGVAVESQNMIFPLEMSASQQNVGTTDVNTAGSENLITNGNVNVRGTAGTNGSMQEDQNRNEEVEDNERLDDDGGGLLSGAGSKLALMQKLQREDTNYSGLFKTFNPTIFANVDNTIAGAAAQARALAGMTMVNTGSSSNTSNITGGDITNQNNSNNQPTAQKKIPTNNITANIVLSNMFSESDVNLEEEPDFFTDICEDVKEECSRHGVIIIVWVNRKKLDGRVWVKFGSIDQALRAYSALNGRFFGGKCVSVDFVSEAIFQATCK